MSPSDHTNGTYPAGLKGALTEARDDLAQTLTCLRKADTFAKPPEDSEDEEATRLHDRVHGLYEETYDIFARLAGEVTVAGLSADPDPPPDAPPGPQS